MEDSAVVLIRCLVEALLSTRNVQSPAGATSEEVLEQLTALLPKHGYDSNQFKLSPQFVEELASGHPFSVESPYVRLVASPGSPYFEQELLTFEYKALREKGAALTKASPTKDLASSLSPQKRALEGFTAEIVESRRGEKKHDV